MGMFSSLCSGSGTPHLASFPWECPSHSVWALTSCYRPPWLPLLSTLFFFDTNNYTPHLVLPHLIVLELKCLGMEEKKGEGKEEHESPLFLKKKTKNFTVYRTFLSIVSNIIPLSSRFHSCYWQVSQSSLLLFECNVFYFSRLLLTLSHCLWFSFTCSFLCISLTWDSLHFVNLWDDVFL